MVTLSDIKERAKQAVSADGDDSDDSDSSTERIDQEQARIERAREEAREQARKQAARERVQEQVSQAREEGAKAGRQEAGVADAGDGAGNGDDRGTLARVTDAIEAATDRVADADGEIIDDIDTAMSTDFDGDGEPFAGEIGLQTNDRAEVENQAFGSLDERVTTNERNITQLEGEVFGGTQQQGTANVDRMSPGGVGGMGASASAGAGLDGGLEPINGLGGLGGPDVGGPSGGLSGGLVEADEGAANESVVESAGAPGLREMGIDPEDGL